MEPYLYDSHLFGNNILRSYMNIKHQYWNKTIQLL